MRCDEMGVVLARATICMRWLRQLPAKACGEKPMNLADVMKAGDRDREPPRNQWAMLDSHAILMRSVLERTVVVELNGQRQLAGHERVDVDAAAMRWQAKEMSTRRAYPRWRHARSKSA